MKKNVVILLLLVLVACGKKEIIVVTPENVREVLTAYGKANPETEVTVETKFGIIRLKLYEDTPLHRANFVKLIKDGHYDEAEFYRIVRGFVIQGGDLRKKLPYLIPAEFNLKYFHKKGALSMARLDENNPQMESSATEFYIIHGNTYYAEDILVQEKAFGITLTPEQRKFYEDTGGAMNLDQKYTVFGEVTEGLDVVEKIATQKVYDLEKPLQKIPLKISVK